MDAGGCVSEQGSFEELRSKDGFVSKVILHPDLLEQGSAKPVEDESKKVSVPKILQGPTANDVAERTRRIGDFAVYKYYYAAIGWKLMLSIMASATVYMVTGNFPCKLGCSETLIYNADFDSIALWLNWYSDGAIKSVALFSTIYAVAAIVSILSMAAALW